MKVTHVINSTEIGGAERQLMHVSAEAFYGFSIDQRVLTLRSGSGSLAPLFSVPVIAPPSRYGLVHALRNIQCALRDSDVVVAWMYHSWCAVLLAKIFVGGGAGILFYCRHAGLDGLKWTTKLVAIIGLIAARVLRIPVVFNSERARKGHGWLLCPGQQVVIRNLVPPIPVMRTGRSHCIGYLGRNHFDKGADLLPDLVKSIATRLPHWGFRMAGPGMKLLEPALRKSIDSLGLDSTFSRLEVRDSIDDVADFLQSIDMLILPSRTESFPNVLVEAMAAELPVAAMDVGEVKAILGGMVPVAETPDKLVDIVATIAGWSDDEWRKVGVKLRELATSRYSASTVVASHLSLWREVAREQH